jgi:imidazolonepropionase-like amidohydrolase
MSATILSNCRIFDGHRPDAAPGMNVLVLDGKIEAISEKPIVAKSAATIDVGGRTLMPGLIDAHVHVYAVQLAAARNRDMPLTLMTARAIPRIRNMLDRGFTSIRDTAGGDVGLREAVEQGFVPGPRLFVGGPGLSQTGGHGDHRCRTDSCYQIDYNASAFVFFSRLVDGPIEIRRAVRDELRKGADHIKIMACGGVGSPSDSIEHVQFTLEEQKAAVEEATAQGKYVCAHVYANEAMQRALEAGVRTLEHANFISSATAAMAVAKKAYVVPTLICYETTAEHGDQLGLTPFVMSKLHKVIQAGVEMLSVCESAGVKMGFGTDLMGELEYAQSNEFTVRSRVQKPIDILRSATSVNAEILQQSGLLGTIAPGAHADMIVCEGDPLSDVTLLSDPKKNLRLIMKGGEIYRNELPVRASAH